VKRRKVCGEEEEEVEVRSWLLKGRRGLRRSRDSLLEVRSKSFRCEVKTDRDNAEEPKAGNLAPRPIRAIFFPSLSFSSASESVMLTAVMVTAPHS
jgi:hypothetical protein